MKRTWYKGIHEGKIFRNCGLVDLDRRRPENFLPWRQAQLNREWHEIFRRGIAEPECEWNPDEPGPNDRIIPYDDSEEATDAWVKNFMAEQGYPNYDPAPHRSLKKKSEDEKHGH